MPNRIEDKRQLLMAELQRYFGETCPALAAAIVGLAPGVLRELSGRLQTFEALTDETNRQLKAAQATAFENQESAETLLDRALASPERLNEVAEAITRQLDDCRGYDRPVAFTLRSCRAFLTRRRVPRLCAG